MKFIDKVIRSWRVKVALGYSPVEMQNVLDIGCDEGYFLKKLNSTVKIKDGVDPRLVKNTCINKDIKLWKGYFPQVVENQKIQGPYDAIFALAVFEHFSDDDINASAESINHLLSKNGRLIITVPHPLVDRILDVLMFLKLIDGQVVEEHHGFEPYDLKKIFTKSLRLIEHKKFQFGLNNIFVFVRK